MENSPEKAALAKFQPDHLVEKAGFGISYSRATDQSKGYAARLYQEAKERNVDMIWDTHANKPFDSFERFVQELTDPKRRLFVILSEDYFKSEHCMRELHEVWKQCSWDKDRFTDRIRVFRMEDANITRLTDQLAIQTFWKEEYESAKVAMEDLGFDYFNSEQKVRLERIRDIAQHTGAMVSAIADRIFPGNLKEFIEAAFQLK